MTSIADLRKSYERAELDESASQADPLQQFDQWLKEAIASEVPEPNAMTLATVASNLRPSTRIVLIKGYDAQGITWFTNYDSRKGQELAGNPFAALQFHWVELERVVRIEGIVEKVSAEESDAYFKTRPLDSRIGAWASPQSEVISGRGVLVANAAKYAAQFLLQGEFQSRSKIDCQRIQTVPSLCYCVATYCGRRGESIAHARQDKSTALQACYVPQGHGQTPLGYPLVILL